MSYTVTPRTPHLAAEVHGLDLTKPVDAETRAALNRAFAESHVLILRDQALTPPQFMAAAEIFGELMPHDDKRYGVPGHPQVYEISNWELAPGKFYIPGETFHTDHSNHPVPPKATTLFAVALPSTGGDTQYVDMHRAYDDLPAATKQRIDGLRAVHVYESRHTPARLRGLRDEDMKKIPAPGIHPLVRTNPDNGRKALYLNPKRIESIVGMAEDEALALVAELMAHATQAKYEYRHQWHLGDMVIWDNRSVLHQANPDYDMREKRYLYRLMLKGEVPVAASLAA